MLKKSPDDVAGQPGETRHPTGTADEILHAIELLRIEVQSQANEIQLLRAEVNAARAVEHERSDAPIADSSADGRSVRAALGTVGAIVGRHGRYLTAAIMASCLLSWILFSDVGSNPAGFFCDEAEIGFRSHQLITDALPALHPKLFYQHFQYPDFGALPLYATAPAVLVLGLSDMSIRLAAVIWSVVALLVLVALIRRLHWRNAEIAIALFACTPIFIHIARVNFGHAPSLLCICLGLYTYVRGRQESALLWSGVSGLFFAASVYGQQAYYVAAPIVLGGLLLGELIVNRTAWRAYRSPGVMLGVFSLSWAPVFYKLATDDEFMKRFHEKQTTSAPFLSGEHLREMLDNYPKYFNFDYLFRVGETGMPGGWDLRHSVPGAGILTWLVLPLVIAGIIAIVRVKDDSSRVIAIAGLATLILYPVPDLITTTAKNPPYTISVYSTLIFVPILAGIGIHWMSGWHVPRLGRAWASWLLPGTLLAIILIGAIRFKTGPYDRYPTVSAGYYGWQYGPGPAIDKFRQHPTGYDRYVLDRDFNEAHVFLDFYLVDDPEMRRRSIIGGLEMVDGQRTELYAIRAEKYDAFLDSHDGMRRYTRLIDTIRYPNGQMAIYIVEIGPKDYWGDRPKPG